MTGLTFQAQEVLATAYDLTRDEVHRALSWARTAKQATRERDKARQIAEAAAAKREAERLILPAGENKRSIVHREPHRCLVWCQQCERRVSAYEATKCLSRFCKAKGVSFPVNATNRDPLAVGDNHQTGA